MPYSVTGHDCDDWRDGECSQCERIADAQARTAAALLRTVERADSARRARNLRIYWATYPR